MQTMDHREKREKKKNKLRCLRKKKIGMKQNYSKRVMFFSSEASAQKNNNPGPGLKHSIGCGHFQPHVRWPAKEIITCESEGEREEREREK